MNIYISDRDMVPNTTNYVPAGLRQTNRIRSCMIDYLWKNLCNLAGQAD